jgi:uncharacterized coiled-coil protein SlyX
MLEFAYNKTMEWLKTQSREQTQTLIALAQERKTVVQQQTKQEQQNLFKKKIRGTKESFGKSQEERTTPPRQD